MLKPPDKPVTIELFTREAIAEILRWKLRREFKNLAEAASHYKTSVAHLSQMQTGRKPITKQIEKILGVEKISGYRMAGENDK